MEGVGSVPAKTGKTGWRWSDDESVCLRGGTVWSIHKGEGADRADLMVVDEGSQLRVPEASIVLGGLRAGTRLADRRRRQAASADHPGDLSRPGARRADPAPFAVRVPEGAGPRPAVHGDAAGELADEPNALHLPGRADLHARIPKRDARDRRPAAVPGQGDRRRRAGRRPGRPGLPAGDRRARRRPDRGREPGRGRPGRASGASGCGGGSSPRLAAGTPTAARATPPSGRTGCSSSARTTSRSRRSAAPWPTARDWHGDPVRRDTSTGSRARNARPSSSATASRTSSRR